MKKYRVDTMIWGLIAGLLLVSMLVLGFGMVTGRSGLSFGSAVGRSTSKQTEAVSQARILANGDILYHDVVYASARQADGRYDVNPYFTYVKDWIAGADLAIGDYEGTISPDFPLAGYPLFNAPAETAQSMKDVGYDVVDLAHNHILDSQLSGAINTARTFKALGLTPIGFYEHSRAEEGITIKEVNGIKLAILGYAYGFNGMEGNLTSEEYARHLSDLDEKKMRAEIEQAEQEADITIVMPQMGEEYALAPNDAQRRLYRQMVDWGADVIFGGHPHVIQPAEVLEKDGQKKLIIYSMGNFLSNQRLETLGNIWTERGLLMDVTFEKSGDQTVLKAVKAHPTMVWAPSKGIGPEGYEYFDYRVMVLEDFLAGGRYRDQLPLDMQERVDVAYEEINELVGLTWQD